LIEKKDVGKTADDSIMLGFIFTLIGQ